MIIKTLNLALRRTKKPRPSLCVLCVHQDPRKCVWKGGFKGIIAILHMDPYVRPLVRL